MGSFGPGSYSAFVCVDFQAERYLLKSPAEYGVWRKDKVYVNDTELGGYGG